MMNLVMSWFKCENHKEIHKSRYIILHKLCLFIDIITN